MTTTTKDIELLLDSNSVPYNITTLGRMLKNLDNEDLDVLYSILLHIEIDEHELEQEYRRGYNKGYSEGFDDGTTSGEQ